MAEYVWLAVTLGARLEPRDHLRRRVSDYAQSLTYVSSSVLNSLSSTCLAATDVRSQDVQDGYGRQGHAVQADRYRDRTAKTPLSS
jgi:hypothetical protein